MKIYQATIWFSVLLILGEVLMLSDLEYVPLSAIHAPRVLGETTNSVLETASKQLYPASYYTTENLINAESNTSTSTTSTIPIKSEILNTISNSATTTETNQETTSPETTGELNRMVQFLNSEPVVGLEIKKETVSQFNIDKVQSLIYKNKTFYFTEIKKELEKIQEGLAP
jgi:hypothetical protein